MLWFGPDSGPDAGLFPTKVAALGLTSPKRGSPLYVKVRVLVAVIFVSLAAPAQGGNCWVGMSRPGRCTSLLNQHVDRETCCSESGGGDGVPGATDVSAAAWSPEDLDAGGLFFWRVLGGGVPCTPCKDSCAGVTCGEGKQCAMRRGRPKCVCAPDCRAAAAASRSSQAVSGGMARRPARGGPVCGTDGRSYRSTCRLLKRACRRGNSSLQVDYHGLCQQSCSSVRCEAGRLCVLDQNATPHCVRCPVDAERRCGASSPSRAVCGADGHTYPSSCHLRAAACRLGRAIPFAYRGACTESAACGKVRCGRRQSCLTVLSTGSARCVSCNFRCGGKHRGGAALFGVEAVDDAIGLPGPLCASNNRTYHSWCHMMRDSCATGFVLETKHSGSCRHKGDDLRVVIPNSGDNVLGISILSQTDLNKNADIGTDLKMKRKAGRILGVLNFPLKRANVNNP